jgi:hypothetical protein
MALRGKTPCRLRPWRIPCKWHSACACLAHVSLARTRISTRTHSQNVVSVVALDSRPRDSFRFLTPAPVASTDAPLVNEVARQAGANPITLPSDHPGAAPTANNNSSDSGEVSPTGVADISVYPAWTDDAKEPPSWYAKGADVDALLDVAGSLDWLVDSGDPNENFTPTVLEDDVADGMPQFDVSPSKAKAHDTPIDDMEDGGPYGHHDSPEEESNFERQLASISSSAELPQTMDDSNMEQVVPPLPSFFGGEHHHASEEHFAASDEPRRSPRRPPSGTVPQHHESAVGDQS